MTDIVVVGSYGVGMTMRVERTPAAGETLKGESFSVGPGGKGSNQAIALARLGADVALLTAVGDDRFGEEAFELWRNEGVDAHYVKCANSPTMVGLILVEPDGTNRICIASGALDDFNTGDLVPLTGRLSRASLLLVGFEIPLETAVAALRTAHHCGVATVLDPAPAAPLPDDAWPLVDHLVPNRTEAALLTGARDDATPQELVERLRALTDAVIVLTLGSDGALVDDGGSRRHIPARTPNKVVDTTGAGDAFTAAYGYAIAQGAAPVAAATYGAAAGAHATSIAEVVPALPSAVELPSFAATEQGTAS